MILKYATAGLFFGLFSRFFLRFVTSVRVLPRHFYGD